MQMDKDELGRRGEALAAQYLEEQGWTVLDRNVVTSFGEIDIVAERVVARGCLQHVVVAFVEVKTRRPRRSYRPEDNVTYRKRKRIVRLATWWLSKRAGPAVGRFDVIAIEWPWRGEPRLAHYPSAFDAEGRLT